VEPGPVAHSKTEKQGPVLLIVMQRASFLPGSVCLDAGSHEDPALRPPVAQAVVHPVEIVVAIWGRNAMMEIQMMGMDAVGSANVSIVEMERRITTVKRVIWAVNASEGPMMAQIARMTLLSVMKAAVK